MTITVPITDPVIVAAVSGWAASQAAMSARPVERTEKETPAVTATTPTSGGGGGRLDTYT